MDVKSPGRVSIIMAVFCLLAACGTANQQGQQAPADPGRQVNALLLGKVAEKSGEMQRQRHQLIIQYEILDAAYVNWEKENHLDLDLVFAGEEMRKMLAHLLEQYEKTRSSEDREDKVQLREMMELHADMAELHRRMSRMNREAGSSAFVDGHAELVGLHYEMVKLCGEVMEILRGIRQRSS